MPTENRDFKGIWIPKEIWLDTRITAIEKVVLMEIDSLDNSEKGCCASNEYLAEMCQCSESKISKAISHLTELGYIYMSNFNGRVRFLRSCLAKNATLLSKKCYHNNIVESYRYDEKDRYIYSGENITNNKELTKTQNISENSKNQADIINKNFERLWKMLPSTQYDRKNTVSQKRKKELLDMGKNADRAIDRYKQTTNPQYYYKRDRFLNEIIDNYISESNSFDIRKNTKSKLENCYQALEQWADEEIEE